MIKQLFPHKNWSYLAVVLVLWAVYALLSLTAPHGHNAYNLSEAALFTLQLTVIVPVLLIWLVAVNGAASFKRYGVMIRDGEDGRGLDLISTGLLLVVLYYILESVLRSLPVYFNGSSFMGLLVAIGNFVPMVIALAGFALIFIGSLKLRNLSLRRLSVGGLTAIVFPYLVLAVIYGWYFYNQLPLPQSNGVPEFSMPGKWPFYVLALPYILTWLLGILAIVLIAEYARTVQGTIYRRVLRDLVRGLTAVLAFSIVLQLLELSQKVFTNLPLGLILLLLYLIIVMYAVGFVFIARGARKLMLIEESL